MLAAMMQQSWAENREQALLYDEEFLRSTFDYPGSSFDLTVAIYENGCMLGFVAGFPRSILWEGRPVRLVLNSFLTAAVGVKGAGLSLKLWAGLIERCRQAGYEGTINFCVEGDDMNRVMPGLSRLLRLDTKRILSVEFLVRLLLPVPPGPLPETSEQDIGLFLELVSPLTDNLPLARTWTRAEAEWQCRKRAGAITVSSRVNGRRGMITGYLTKVASMPPTPVVLIEDLLWGDLELSDRIVLVQRFLRAAAGQGARTASCAILGYASLEPLLATRFRPSKRVLHTYLTFWNGAQPHEVSALYTDVF